MASEIDPSIKQVILDLNAKGCTRKQIVERTGVSESTVKRVIKRAREGSTAEPPKDSCTHTHDNNPGQPQVQPLNPSADPGQPKAINPNLNQANTASELLDYTQFFRRRTKSIRYPSLSDHDKVWAEGNYGKRWGEGIKMMIETTGLSPESILQAVDDYEMDVSVALERFNALYGKEGAEEERCRASRRPYCSRRTTGSPSASRWRRYTAPGSSTCGRGPSVAVRRSTP
jgi:hypothetical protein